MTLLLFCYLISFLAFLNVYRGNILLGSLLERILDFPLILLKLNCNDSDDFLTGLTSYCSMRALISDDQFASSYYLFTIRSCSGRTSVISMLFILFKNLFLIFSSYFLLISVSPIPSLLSFLWVRSLAMYSSYSLYPFLCFECLTLVGFANCYDCILSWYLIP